MNLVRFTKKFVNLTNATLCYLALQCIKLCSTCHKSHLRVAFVLLIDLLKIHEKHVVMDGKM